MGEKRPSVIRGDRVLLYEIGPDDKPCEMEVEGIVHDVQLERVLLGLNHRWAILQIGAV